MTEYFMKINNLCLFHIFLCSGFLIPVGYILYLNYFYFRIMCVLNFREYLNSNRVEHVKNESTRNKINSTDNLNNKTNNEYKEIAECEKPLLIKN